MDNDSAEVIVAAVTAEFFEAVDVMPYAGRRCDVQECSGNGSPVMLSHACGASHFGARPDVIGSSITVANVAPIIVGSMPPGFELPEDVAIWIPAEAPVEGGS